MSALGILIGEIALKALGKKIQKKLDKKPDVKKAIKEVGGSLTEAPVSTLTGSTLAIAALIIGCFDLPPEQSAQMIPYAQEILAGAVGFIGAWIATLQKKDK